MNFRNRYLILTMRTLFGLLLVFSGSSGLFQGSSTEGVPEAMIPLMNALWAAGIIQMIKVTELFAGLMFLLGVLPALAAIFAAPIAVGVVIVNARLMPEFVVVGLLLCAFEAFFGYVYWSQYRHLFHWGKAAPK